MKFSEKSQGNNVKFCLSTGLENKHEKLHVSPHKILSDRRSRITREDRMVCWLERVGVRTPALRGVRHVTRLEL